MFEIMGVAKAGDAVCSVEILERRALLSSSAVTFGPDPSFGSDGVVTHTATASGDAVIALPNGDTVVAETVPYASYPDQVVLQRYLPNGKLDPSFGTGGSTSLAANSVIDGLVRDTSGRILVLLQTLPNPNSSPQHWYNSITRLNANGTLDKSYGSGGLVSPIAPDMYVSQSSFTVDDKARVLIGWSNSQGTSHIARFTPQGQLDTSFGEGGVINYGGFCLGFQPDGKVLVGTSVTNATVANEPAVIRYNANGSLDTSFGNGGVALATLPLPPDTPTSGPGVGASVGSLAVFSDGDIAITGYYNDQQGFRPTPDEKLYVTKFSSQGVPVKGFGSDGATITVIDPATPAGSKQIEPSLITPQPDGSLIISGDYFPTNGGDNGATSSAHIMVADYGADGNLNRTFGSGGVALAPMPGSFSTLGEPTTTPSFAGGKITVASDTGLGGDDGFDLFRYDVQTTATVSGTVVNDLNGDGIRQKNEAGLAGVFVYADATNVGYYVVGDPSTTTSPNGTFILTGLDSGNYSIRVRPAIGFYQTHPAGKSGFDVNLFSDSVISGLLFSEAKITV